MFFCKLFVFMQLFVVLYYFFLEQMENNFLETAAHQRYWQLNFLQNDVCFNFNHLGQKLREKIHFKLPKVNFSGEGKSTSI